mgnify:CR=1 FL=1
MLGMNYGPDADPLAAGDPWVDCAVDWDATITKIIEGFARRMRFDPEGMRAGTRKQATLPEGGRPLDPVGTAPRFHCSS